MLNLQVIKSQKITRAPYTGPVCESELNSTNDNEKPATQAEKVDEFYNRSTRSGGRHQQDSSFHLSGDYRLFLSMKHLLDSICAHYDLRFTL